MAGKILFISFQDYFEGLSMSNYRFQCPNCKIEKEEYLQMKHKDTIQLCPKCGVVMNRLIGRGINFCLKGKDFIKKVGIKGG